MIAAGPLRAQAAGSEGGDGTAEARVLLRVEAWSNFARGDGMYRVLFSEVTGEQHEMAPLVEGPPNAFELVFLPESWPEREDGFYRFDFAVKPGRYAISFVFWANQTGETTAVGQDITNIETLHFTLRPGGVNYLGDFRLRFDDMAGHATQTVRQTGHGLAGSAGAELHRVEPEIGPVTCPVGSFGASRRTCMRAAMDGQKHAAPRAVVEE